MTDGSRSRISRPASKGSNVATSAAIERQIESHGGSGAAPLGARRRKLLPNETEGSAEERFWVQM
jgi:hypothetical protein